MGEGGREEFEWVEVDLEGSRASRGVRSFELEGFGGSVIIREGETAEKRERSKRQGEFRRMFDYQFQHEAPLIALARNR